MKTPYLTPGAELGGRYRIAERLGEGGMGIVYKALHISLNKAVAVKVLRPEVSREPEVVQRFRREAQATTAIGNHHIVDITDFGELEDGSAYFVMELLQGIALADVLAPGRPLEVERTLHIARQLCGALSAAHDIQIVHRDLKPDNVFLVKRGTDADFVKVLDFGIAKVKAEGTQLTQTGQIFGTAAYMSPEQAEGRAVDARTDIYALGVVLYEMVTGRVPFEADSFVAMLVRHIAEPPPPLATLATPFEAPPALERVIMKCLAKQPAARFQSMGELEAELAAIARQLQGAPGVASGPGHHARVRADLGHEPAFRGAEPSRARAVSRAGVGLALALAAGSVGYALATTERRGSSSRELLQEPVRTPAADAALQAGEAMNLPDGEVLPQQAAERTPGPASEEDSGRAESLSPTIALRTSPPKVMVLLDGAFIGMGEASKVFTYPRPAGPEQAVTLTLTAPGYKPLQVKLTPQTEPQLNLALQPKPKPKRDPNVIDPFN